MGAETFLRINNRPPFSTLHFIIRSRRLTYGQTTKTQTSNYEIEIKSKICIGNSKKCLYI